MGVFETITDAAKALGFSVGHVSSILTNYRDRHYGKYKNKIHYV